MSGIRGTIAPIEPGLITGAKQGVNESCLSTRRVALICPLRCICGRDFQICNGIMHKIEPISKVEATWEAHSSFTCGHSFSVESIAERTPGRGPTTLVIDRCRLHHTTLLEGSIWLGGHERWPSSLTGRLHLLHISRFKPVPFRRSRIGCLEFKLWILPRVMAIAI